MATLYVTEFNAGGGVSNFPLSAAQQTPVAEQTVNIGGASAQSNAFNANTTLVRLHTDAICSIEFGANPTSTALKARMAANQTEYFSIPPNSGWKVAVITNS
jgi:hypothetical protein